MNILLGTINFRKTFSKILILNPKIRSIFDSKQSMGSGIPRLIYQTGPWNWEDVPMPIKENVAKLKERNKGWTYVYYTDLEIENFILREYGPDLLQSYLRIDPRLGPARADLFRYLVIHRLGGVYLDIKSTAGVPFDNILRDDDSFILSQWGYEPENRRTVKIQPEKRKFGIVWKTGTEQHEDLSHIEGGEFIQWFIASTPGHPFLKNVISAVLENMRNYNPVLHGYGKSGVLRVTGPIAYTLAIEALLQAAPHRYLLARTDLGLEYSFNWAHKDTGDVPHASLFAKHYSQLRVPVLHLSLRKKLLMACLWPVATLFALFTSRTS